MSSSFLTQRGVQSARFFRKNEDALFRSALRITQSNAKVLNNVGHVLEKTKNYTEALNFFASAAR